MYDDDDDDDDDDDNNNNNNNRVWILVKLTTRPSCRRK